MHSGTGKVCSFLAGLLLVLAGAFDLYAGIVNFGLIEGALAEVSRSLMLLFPGYVFLMYSLHPSLTLSSQGIPASRDRVQADTTEGILPDPVPENVIVFPQRSGGRGATTPEFRSYN